MKPDATSDRVWFESIRWPGGITCPYCESRNVGVADNTNAHPYRCRDCFSFFSWMTAAGALAHIKTGATKLHAMVHRMSSEGAGSQVMPIARAVSVTKPTARRIAAIVFDASEAAGYAVRRHDTGQIQHRIGSVDATAEQIVRAMIDYRRKKKTAKAAVLSLEST